MKNEFRHYLPFYIGSECMIGDLSWKSQNIAPEDRMPYIDPDFGKPYKSKIDLHVIQVFSHLLTPILRPLSSMTNEDCPAWFKEWMPDGFEVMHQRNNNFHWIEIDSEANDGYTLTIRSDGSMDCVCKDNGEQYGYKGAELFKHLLSLGFDLFGLIKSGVAIESALSPKEKGEGA